MTTPTPERRRHCRIPLETDVSVQVMFPEETFTPHPMHGVTRELSLGGVRVLTYQASEEYYRQIIHKIRYAKLCLLLPGCDTEFTLHGRISWVQYDNKTDPPSCTFGITFDETNGEMLVLYRRELERIESQRMQQTTPGRNLTPPPQPLS